MQVQSNEKESSDWLASGQHTMLRPVLTGDLPRLAYLLAEAPLGIDDEPFPWTESRLRRKFEDKSSPGLWGDNKKLYVVATRDDQVAGYVSETVRNTGGTVIRFHVGELVESRDVVGVDAVATYMGMARRWHPLHRVSANVLACEKQKRAWLESAGFELEVTCREAVFYQGRPVDCLIYGWVADWALANRAEATAGSKELS